MPLRPCDVVGGLLDPEEAVGIQPQPARPQVSQRVQRVTDHQPHAGEGRVEPVDRRLALLEVVQVDPAPRDAVDPGHDPRRAPVGLLDARLVEDHPLQPADDVAGALERQLGVGVEVERVAALGDLRQQVPVLLADRDHVVDAGVVAVADLGQAEVGALAGVARDDVVDHRALVLGGGRAQAPELVLGAELGVDRHRDAVEVAVDGRRQATPVQASRLLDRPGVDAVDPDRPEGLPQRGVGERGQERLAAPRDERERIRRQPHRSPLQRRTRVRMRVRVLPHAALAGELRREPVGVGEHRLLDQPFHVGAVVRDGGAVAVAGQAVRDAAAQRTARRRAKTAWTSRVELLVVGDLGRVALFLITRNGSLEAFGHDRTLVPLGAPGDTRLRR